MRAPWLVIGFILAFVLFTASAWPDVHYWLVKKNFTTVAESSGYGRATVKFSEVTVEALVPLTPNLQRRGLAKRTGLGSREGMLFTYQQPSRYAFWMNGMLFPLDFIWINDNRVVDLTVDVPTPLPDQTDLPIYRPEFPITSMLEVAGGFAAANNIKIGDVVKIELK